MGAGFVPPWQPFCGHEFYGPVAGHPVVCDLERHGPHVMHCSSESGFRWWGFMSYPRRG